MIIELKNYQTKEIIVKKELNLNVIPKLHEGIILGNLRGQVIDVIYTINESNDNELYSKIEILIEFFKSE